MESPFFNSFLLFESLPATDQAMLTSRSNSTSGELNTTAAVVVDDHGDVVPLFEEYAPALLYLASACCILFILVGIPGNLITIIALFRCKKVRNATAVFIINLSVSDLMFCCFNLPLAASVFWQRAWHHGAFLCQMFPLLRYGLLAVSLFTILAITINRYVMIGHPTLYPKLYSRRYLGLMVACTWIFGFGALIATWFGRWGRFGLDQVIGSCSILPDEDGRSPKVFLFLVAFVIPCLAIFVCYARIFYIVRATAIKSRLNTHNTKISSLGSVNKKVRCKFQAGEDSAIGSTSCSTTATSDNSFNNNKPGNLLALPCKAPYESSVSSGVDINEEDNVSTRSDYTPRQKRRRKTLTTHVATVLRRRHSNGTQCNSMMTAKDKKLLQMILVIFASFVVCYLPITISKIFHNALDIRGLNIAGYILIYLTTCINPIIYVVMSSEYRQAYKNLLMCRSGDVVRQGNT